MSDDPFLDQETSSKKSSAFLQHPQATFFHCFFRGAAIVTYLFGGIITSSFVSRFIFILLLLSADFWTVKNISGRLLVGLRWWNQVDEEGKSTWVFESRSQRSLQRNPISAKESTIFWITLLVCPVMWVLFFFSSFVYFGWKWLPLVIIAITLNGANLVGYLRCKFSGTQQISKIANDYLAASMLKKAMNVIPGFGSKPAADSTF
jgi:hypothetical protein